MWCPTPGCESVCRIQENVASFEEKTPGSKPRSSSANKSLIINCTTCQKSFCAECKLSWHPGTSCESFRRKLIKQGKLSLEDEELFSLDSIKKCPFCHVPIEKDSGCAQMMCKRCKHVFCWYCLASLDVRKVYSALVHS
jgi:E3 ubiquitin-protein ligase RNF144